MNILTVGDLHIGAKQDDPWIQNIQREFFDWAIDFSKKNGITQWIQKGDWFDVRKAITHKSMEFNREQCQKLLDAGIQVDVIVGNHDAHYKNTLVPNACDEVLTQFSNITVYSKPTTKQYGDLLIDLIPWMCQDNTEEILKHIKTSSATHCVGHWELNGFYFYKGLKSHGIEPDFLKKYKKVLSGHFHTHSEAGNVIYTGTPYQLNSGDENDPRGVWVLNTKDESLKFHENPRMWFKKISYPCTIKPEDYRDLSVRVVVTEVDKNLTKFESALEAVVHSLKLISKVDTSSDYEGSDEEVEVKSLSQTMDEYIDGLVDCNDEDKAIVKNYVKMLYVEVSK